MKTELRISQRLAAIERERLPLRNVLSGAVSVGVAATAGARLDAARLVGRLYSAEGYLGDDHEADTPFFTLHHLLPESTVFVAREGPRVIGTFTVILDSAAGLPMENLYGEDVAALRASQRRVCEICSLAVDPYRENSSSAMVLKLFRCATIYLLHLTDFTDLLITLKPSHADFYGRRLGFARFGEMKYDARFRDAETVAMRLPRERVERLADQSPLSRQQRWMAEFFAPASGAELDALTSALPFKGLSVDELRARLAAKRDVLASACPNVKRQVADAAKTVFNSINSRNLAS